MAEQQPATLLATLVAQSERTHDEIVDGFLRCARENDEDATLSLIFNVGGAGSGPG